MLHSRPHYRPTATSVLPSVHLLLVSLNVTLFSVRTRFLAPHSQTCGHRCTRVCLILTDYPPPRSPSAHKIKLGSIFPGTGLHQSSRKTYNIVRNAPGGHLTPLAPIAASRFQPPATVVAIRTLQASVEVSLGTAMNHFTSAAD